MPKLVVGPSSIVQRGIDSGMSIGGWEMIVGYGRPSPSLRRFPWFDTMSTRTCL